MSDLGQKFGHQSLNVPQHVMPKSANDIAKNNPIFASVLVVMGDTLVTWLLPIVPVGDILEIGHRTDAKLHGLGIRTAAEPRDFSIRQARSLGTVVLERSVPKLRGQPSLAFDALDCCARVGVSSSSAKVMSLM